MFTVCDQMIAIKLQTYVYIPDKIDGSPLCNVLQCLAKKGTIEYSTMWTSTIVPWGKQTCMSK